VRYWIGGLAKEHQLHSRYSESTVHNMPSFYGWILQLKALRKEPRSLGQASPIRKHAIAVQPKTKVKIASFDQDAVAGVLDVGSLRLVGSVVGRATIGRMRKMNDRKRREIMLGDDRRRCCTRWAGVAKDGGKLVAVPVMRIQLQQLRRNGGIEDFLSKRQKLLCSCTHP
jgi:hypothetical protein